MRVAVIGAGAAGLSALKHLKTGQQRFKEITCFEMLHEVGGTWNYTDQIGGHADGLPVMSSMYKNLVTNLPKEVMAFPDYPFKSSLPSFVHHTEVLNYLKDYAEHYKLTESIMFNTIVTRIHPIEQSKFQVCFRNRLNKNCDERIYDFILVCNGHNSTPHVPHIPGIEKFRGHVMHSHDYRTPERFQGMKVACLGAKASGQDISIELSSVAESVYLCHRDKPMTMPLPKNLHQKPCIKEFLMSSAVLEDGSEIEIDAFMYCTGYEFNFPFLTPECGITMIEGTVFPLYKHIVCVNSPSLMFIGICQLICPFPLFDVQARFCLALLEGNLKIPTPEEMMKDIEKDIQQRLDDGLPRRYAHLMGDRQWPYNDELAELARTQPIPRAVEKLYRHVHHVRRKNLLQYRSKNYNLIGSDDFKSLN